MNRFTHRTAGLFRIAFLLTLMTLVLVSCTPKTPETSTTTTTTETRVQVDRIDLGKEMTADRRVVTTTEVSFAPADTVHAAVIYTTPAPAATIVARWSSPDGQVAGETTEIVTPGADGSAVTMIHLVKPAGLAPGAYKVEILSDGVVIGTKDFTVVAN